MSESIKSVTAGLAVSINPAVEAANKLVDTYCAANEMANLGK